jgi:hypothetical protein
VSLCQDADIVDKVVENSSLTSMKKNPEHWTFTKNDEFIRKGRAAWQGVFKGVFRRLHAAVL